MELGALGVLLACSGDPSSPAALRLVVRPDTIRIRSLADTQRARVFELRYGRMIPVPYATFVTHEQSIASVSADGLITSRNVGTTHLIVRSPAGVTGIGAVIVSQDLARVRIPQDTLEFGALGAEAPMGAIALDALGSPIPGQAFTYASGDTTIASVSAAGLVRAHGNGTTVVTAFGGDQSVPMVVRVVQRPASIVPDRDTVRFASLGETQTIASQILDSLGSPIPQTRPQVVVGDTSVLEVVDSISVRAKKNGSTFIELQAGALAAQQVAHVSQVPERLIATFSDTFAIQSLIQDSLLPLHCALVDHLGVPVESGAPVDPAVLPSQAGLWSGNTCSTLRIQASGLDTLRITWDTLSTMLPVVLAVRPIVGVPAALTVDQLPVNTFPWAPSARLNSQGVVELYVAAYANVPDSTGRQPADLYRLVSADGQQFSFDGLVLAHDSVPCALNATGIENISVVPRADGPGWRMFYAGGSLGCYGWQVFSAVSADERTWTKEPGIRIRNGSPVPPDAPGDAPWPAGEGIVTDQLPDGTWRMTVGTYEPLVPSENKFQITEWQSPDQLTWTYVRTLLSTRQLPAEGQRSAYSPTLAQIAPGLWRMIFTADDRNQPNGRSRLWSAVSTDRIQWQVEGEILGAPGVEYFYSTLVGNRLYSIQAPQGGVGTTLIGVTVQQP